MFGTAIRIRWVDNEPLFVMRDVCDALKISKYRDAFRRLDEYEKTSMFVSTNMDTNRGPRKMAVVTESGLYHLTFMSNKPIAKAFRKWVTSEVLPSLRREGFYALPAWTGGADPLGFVGSTARQYLDNRGLTGLSPSGVSRSCSVLCAKRGIEPSRRWSGTVYPVAILDLAVRGRDAGALRGPAEPERPNALQFLTDRDGIR